jgi:prephenate dehydratase
MACDEQSETHAEAQAGPLPRVAHLGPAGTFSEEALLASARPGSVRPVAMETIYETAMAVVRGEAEWAVLPIENSLEGSVTLTLDLLADHAAKLRIVAERLLAVRHFLCAREQMPLAEIRRVLTHPQVPGQCRRFLRERLPHAEVMPATSTAEAVRIAAGAAAAEGTAGIGPHLATQIYGAVILQADVQDRDDNLTRFVWLGPRDADWRKAPVTHPPRPQSKTSLVFWGPGADRAGWLVLCLDQFAHRGINLTKIESRPRRERMGHYMFFVDLEGGAGEPDVAEAISGLGELCERVWVLGSYPVAAED